MVWCLVVDVPVSWNSNVIFRELPLVPGWAAAVRWAAGSGWASALAVTCGTWHGWPRSRPQCLSHTIPPAALAMPPLFHTPYHT